MIPQLVFTLAAPFGSFAVTRSAANAAVKPSVLEPPKSALVGLLGAALGWERERLGGLSDAFHVAVREGLRPRPDPIWDFHTITKPVRPPGGGSWTRFEELRGRALQDLKGPAGSTMSRREFWSVGLWTISLARTGSGGPSLTEVQAALCRPHWPLFAGRKAYALGLPPDPEIVQAAGPAAAHTSYGWPWERHPDLAGDGTPLAALRAARGNWSRVQLLFDVGYPGAPAFDSEVERADLPFPGLTAEGRLVRGYAPRRVRHAYVPGQRPGAEHGHA